VKLEHRVVVSAPPERVWGLLMDVPAAARRIPGVESVEPLGADRYRGRLRVQLGPVRLAFEGDLALEDRDDAARTATLRGSGTDKGSGGGVRALVGLAVAAASAGGSEIHITTDVQLGGRIAELGQPLIKRQADRTLEAFAASLRRDLA